MNEFTIRAKFDDKSIRVYQAYPSEIAAPSVEAGRFISPFKFSRMTWIKPSFFWMMYRSGYGTKLGQEHILAIDISRSGFDWALDHGVLSSYHENIHGDFANWRRQLSASPVRIQWDPERDIFLNKIDNLRTIQIGLRDEVVIQYNDFWIRNITDITPEVRMIRMLLEEKKFREAAKLAPSESAYPFSYDC